MKKKLLIICVLFVALVGATAGTYTFLNSSEAKPKITQEELANVLANDIQLMTYGLAQKQNPEYVVLKTNNLDDLTVSELRNELDYSIRDSTMRLLNDPLFEYWVIDVRTGEELQTNSKVAMKTVLDKAQFSGDVTFDEMNTINLSDSLKNVNFESDSYLKHTVFNGPFYGEYRNDFSIFSDDVELETPKNLRFVYAIESRDDIESSLIRRATQENRSSKESLFILFVIGTASIGVALLMLMLPYKIVGEIEPFKTSRKFYIEILVVMYVMVFALGGTLLDYLIDNLTLGFSPIITEMADKVILISVLFAGFYVVANLIDSIKRIFKEGFWNTLKNGTLTGTLVKGIARFFNTIIRVPLESKIFRKIFMIVAVLVVVMSALALMGPFGSFLILILGVFVIYKIHIEFNRIISDYNNTLGVVKEIAKGQFRDISAMTSKEGTFSTLNNELLTIQNGFEEAVEKERKAQKMRTELITNVSHDLKTPITGIQSYVELLGDETTDPEIAEYIKQIKHYTQRLNVLIQDVFDLSEVSSGTLNLEYHDVNLVSLLEQVEGEFATQLEEKNLNVLWNVDASLSPIRSSYLDGERTYRIFENLFSNIVKYAMQSTRVYIDVVFTESAVDIDLKNTSEDVIALDQGQLRERFVRGESSRNVQGNGLGLSIAESLTVAQGGSFNVIVDGDLFKVQINFK